MVAKLVKKSKQHAENKHKSIESEEGKATINPDESFSASELQSFNPGVMGPGDVKRKDGNWPLAEFYIQ
jgi:hypothetical protein